MYISEHSIDTYFIGETINIHSNLRLCKPLGNTFKALAMVISACMLPLMTVGGFAEGINRQEIRYFVVGNSNNQPEDIGDSSILVDLNLQKLAIQDCYQDTDNTNDRLKRDQQKLPEAHRKGFWGKFLSLIESLPVESTLGDPTDIGTELDKYYQKYQNAKITENIAQEKVQLKRKRFGKLSEQY